MLGGTGLLRPEDFFDLDSFEFSDVFDHCDYVWQALVRIGVFALGYITEIDGENTIFGEVRPGAHIDDCHSVVVGHGTVVEPGAYIQGPAVIGENCQIRHGAYIRGHVIIGNGCIVGHSSELKNAIMLDSSQAPHFAYVGDSILGRKANLGAGTRLSNVPVLSVKDEATGKRPTIKIKIGDTTYDTGLQKFGAIIGDGVQTGCNVVTNPGTLIAPGTMVYPNVSVRKGYYGPNQILKLTQNTELIERF